MSANKNKRDKSSTQSSKDEKESPEFKRPNLNDMAEATGGSFNNFQDGLHGIPDNEFISSQLNLTSSFSDTNDPPVKLEKVETTNDPLVKLEKVAAYDQSVMKTLENQFECFKKSQTEKNEKAQSPYKSPNKKNNLTEIEFTKYVNQGILAAFTIFNGYTLRSFCKQTEPYEGLENSFGPAAYFNQNSYKTFCARATITDPKLKFSPFKGEWIFIAATDDLAKFLELSVLLSTLYELLKPLVDGGPDHDNNRVYSLKEKTIEISYEEFAELMIVKHNVKTINI